MTIEKAGCVSAFRPLFGCKPYVYLQGSPYAHLQVFFPCPTFIYNTKKDPAFRLCCIFRLSLIFFGIFFLFLIFFSAGFLRLFFCGFSFLCRQRTVSFFQPVSRFMSDSVVNLNLPLVCPLAALSLSVFLLGESG